MHLTTGRSRAALLAVAAAALAVLATVAGVAGFARRRGASQAAAQPFALPQGLTEGEALLRLAARAEGGDAGSAGQPSPVRTWDRVRRESVFTIFNLNLIGLSLVQMLLRDWWGAMVSLILLSFTTGIRLLQERLAGRRITAFLAGRSPRYTVVREGRARSVEPALVVAGDVMLVGPGDQLLADGVLLGPTTLLIDDSPVTGTRGWRRVRRGGRLHGGSFCVTGRGLYVAERLGDDRVLAGRVAAEPTHSVTPTPLERLVARILQGLLAVVVLYAALLLAAWFRLDIGAPGYLIVDAAPVIFSLAPSGLYLMIIVTYATGTADLAQRGALVRSARSVESLAETTVLCFTELGILAGTSVELTIVPHRGHDQLSESEVRQLLGDAARSTAGTDPIAAALAETFEGERRPVRDEVSTLGTLGWRAITFADVGVEGVFVLGERAVIETGLTAPLPGGHDAEADLVFAYHPGSVELRDGEGRARLPGGLIALATVRHRRELRPEAVAVVRKFVEAGVRIRVFAAYSPGEAVAMLRAAGMDQGGLDYVVSRGMMSGDELEQIPRQEWGRVAQEHALFGGLTPLQVGEVVRALRRDGETVAVVGDGVRDLPALQEATLAVAQPGSTQAALGLADIVLLDNSPAALLKVLGRGQAIVRGLIDVLKLNLTMVVCSALLIISVRLTSVGFPYVASQGAIISILTVTIPSVVLSVSLSSRTRTVSRSTYTRTLTGFVLPAGVSLSLVALAVYVYFVRTSGLVSTAQLAVTWTLLYAGLTVGFLARRTRVQAVLALSLAAVGTLLPLIPWARRQFRLRWLQPSDYAVLLLAVAGWAAALLLVWALMDARRRRVSTPTVDPAGVG